ncbi:hypothetical protein Tco_0899537 [Tanacetum coccineum]
MNEAANVSTSAKDGPNIVSKNQPAKAVDIPSSSYTNVTTKKGGQQVSTSLSNVPTSNPYDWLSQEFDPENYTRSGGCPNVLDDIKSEEEVEVVFDETVNLPSSKKRRLAPTRLLMFPRLDLSSICHVGIFIFSITLCIR